MTADAVNTLFVYAFSVWEAHFPDIAALADTVFTAVAVAVSTIAIFIADTGSALSVRGASRADIATTSLVIGGTADTAEANAAPLVKGTGLVGLVINRQTLTDMVGLVAAFTSPITPFVTADTIGTGETGLAAGIGTDAVIDGTAGAALALFQLAFALGITEGVVGTLAGTAVTFFPTAGIVDSITLVEAATDSCLGTGTFTSGNTTAVFCGFVIFAGAGSPAEGIIGTAAIAVNTVVALTFAVFFTFAALFQKAFAVIVGKFFNS